MNNDNATRTDYLTNCATNNCDRPLTRAIRYYFAASGYGKVYGYTASCAYHARGTYSVAIEDVPAAE